MVIIIIYGWYTWFVVQFVVNSHLWYWRAQIALALWAHAILGSAISLIQIALEIRWFPLYKQEIKMIARNKILLIRMHLKLFKSDNDRAYQLQVVHPLWTLQDLHRRDPRGDSDFLAYKTVMGRRCNKGCCFYPGSIWKVGFHN